jgi:tetratricopeptide (TPR) repeat protein
MIVFMTQIAPALVWLCMLPGMADTAGDSQAPPMTGAAAESADLDAFKKRADSARGANRLDEAVAVYREAVRLHPKWTEGHWYLGTISYELGSYATCQAELQHVVRVQTKNGAAWGFKGLCEYQLKKYSIALDDLTRAKRLGVGEDADFLAVIGYHRAILLARAGQFERAFDAYTNLVRGGNTALALLDAVGIAMLRLPLLPDEVPPEQRDVVRLAGRAGAYGIARMREEARDAYEQLLTRYPDTPGVHFLYGNFLFAQELPDAALEQFRMEIARSPNHVPARLQLALELVKRGDFDAARPYATDAVQLAPGNFVARRVLGQIKLQTGDAAGAIAELEAARSLEPSSPSVRFHLARAYQRAGRTVDATRERAEFTRLEGIQQKQRGANLVGVDPGEP